MCYIFGMRLAYALRFVIRRVLFSLLLELYVVYLCIFRIAVLYEFSIDTRINTCNGYKRKSSSASYKHRRPNR